MFEPIKPAPPVTKNFSIKEPFRKLFGVAFVSGDSRFDSQFTKLSEQAATSGIPGKT
jgi:hypothetical protein